MNAALEDAEQEDIFFFLLRPTFNSNSSKHTRRPSTSLQDPDSALESPGSEDSVAPDLKKVGNLFNV